MCAEYKLLVHTENVRLYQHGIEHCGRLMHAISTDPGRLAATNLPFAGTAPVAEGRHRCVFQAQSFSSATDVSYA